MPTNTINVSGVTVSPCTKMGVPLIGVADVIGGMVTVVVGGAVVGGLVATVLDGMAIVVVGEMGDVEVGG